MQHESARQLMVRKAEEFGVTLDPQEVVITSASGQVTISFAFERAIEFPGYTYPITFQVSATSRRVRR